jgi:hypothetical protein
MSQKLYILVKEDLTPAQKAVQACHAVQAWDASEFGNPTFSRSYELKVETKVICTVSDWQYDIQKRRITQRGINYAEFCEPDMDNRPTALACLYDGNLFSDLKMME